jgi:hypothetical protein
LLANRLLLGCPHYRLVASRSKETPCGLGLMSAAKLGHHRYHLMEMRIMGLTCDAGLVEEVVPHGGILWKLVEENPVAEKLDF